VGRQSRKKRVTERITCNEKEKRRSKGRIARGVSRKVLKVPGKKNRNCAALSAREAEGKRKTVKRGCQRKERKGGGSFVST